MGGADMTKDIVGIAAQVIGIAAMLVAVLSFQCRKNSHFCIVQAVSALLFAINYVAIGAYTGAVSNIINILRGTSFGLLDRRYRNVSCIVLLILYTAGTIFTYSGFFSAIILVSQLAGTTAIWHDNGKIMRIVQFFCISPIWLLYSIYYFSPGGIICECFTLLSVIVSVIRYGFNGFEK